MYPLAVILGIATFRADGGIRIYGRVLAGIGAAIAAYHLALEWIPALDTGACGVGPACTLVWFRALGFVSLPFLALSAFLLIFTLLSVRGDRLPPRRLERTHRPFLEDRMTGHRPPRTPGSFRERPSTAPR